MILTSESRVVIIFRARSPIFFIAFLVSIYGDASNHIPLKYRCPVKISNQIGHIYLTLYDMQR